MLVCSAAQIGQKICIRSQYDYKTTIVIILMYDENGYYYYYYYVSKQNLKTKKMSIRIKTNKKKNYILQDNCKNILHYWGPFQKGD